MKKEIKTSLSISRPQYGDGRENIRISIEDKSSSQQFIEVEVGYSEFAKALTGLSFVECNATVRGLDNVGKTKQRKELNFYWEGGIPKGEERNEKAISIAKTKVPDGWILDEFLGSQKSFHYSNGKTNVSMSMYRYVDHP